jgi:hypothetical protein
VSATPALDFGVAPSSEETRDEEETTGVLLRADEPPMPLLRDEPGRRSALEPLLRLPALLARVAPPLEKPGV